MSGFTVAPAGEADLVEWEAMRCRLWPEADPAEIAEEVREMAAKPAGSKHCWIARSDQGEVIGFAEADIRYYAEGCEGPTPFVEAIWVNEEWRGRKVAAAMLAQIEDWARRSSFRELASDALLANENSHAWHRATGFAEVERIVIFRKDL